MLVAELQSWARCKECHTVMWVEPSVDEQRAVCRCGKTTLHDGVVSGVPCETLTSEEMQTLIDSGEY